MLRYKFPSCKSIRILTILMSGPAPGEVLEGVLPQDTERRCDLTAVCVVGAEGAGSVGGGDESTSRQETEGDFMC